jgi:SAM-dependent methyltransferase
MYGGSDLSHAANILAFINHRYPSNALAEYSKRVHDLRHLQREFEANGVYPARHYWQVKPINDEAYKLALLLSFICNNHRFEILAELERFLRQPSLGSAHLLSIGYGTGYELKLARQILPDWRIDAFDTSEESFAYATDLLAFFKCGPVALRRELFPLETADGLERYRGVFGKIVLCELLEHLEDPATALRNLRYVLHDNGHIFLTMAVNIAQEDHLFLYSSAEQARQQVLDCGLKIVNEMLAPVVMLPFEEAEREALFQKGNYICVVEKTQR